MARLGQVIKLRQATFYHDKDDNNNGGDFLLCASKKKIIITVRPAEVFTVQVTHALPVWRSKNSQM